MALSDELIGAPPSRAAYSSTRATPVELVEAILAASRPATPSVTPSSISVLTMPGDVRERPNSVDVRRRARPAARRADRDQGPVRFQARWPSTFGGVRALKTTSSTSTGLAERMERAGAIIVGKTNSPVMGSAAPATTRCSGRRAIRSTSRNTGGSSGGGAAAVADGLLPLAEGTDGGGPSASPRHGAASTATSSRRARAVHRAPQRLRWRSAVPVRRPITRTVEDAALALTALTGTIPRSLQPRRAGRFRGRHATLDPGWKIAYSPDFDVFPMDRRVTDVVGKGRQGVRGGRCAGRGGEVGISGRRRS